MSAYNREMALFVSSDPALGAHNISTGGDYWQTSFAKPLIFPSREKSSNYTVSLHSGSIWWVSRNITAANNAFTITLGATVLNITLAPGLYGISEISNAVAIELVNAGFTGNEVSFTGDSATQKVVTNLDATGVAVPGLSVTFPVGGFGALMGISPVPTTFGPVLAPNTQHFLAPDIAEFSTISSFFYQTDLVNEGIPIGNKSSNAIGQAIINVAPGSLINTTPPGQLLPINADNLAGSTINTASFWVTSQTGERGLDFGSPTPEFCTLTILIRWKEDE
jgi:hypothetical protein